MRMITNEELLAVAGGGLDDDGWTGPKANSNSLGSIDDMQMIAPAIGVAIIAGAAAIISAVIALFKDPAPSTPVASKVTTTTYNCETSAVDGEQICTVTGIVVTDTEYVKP